MTLAPAVAQVARTVYRASPSVSVRVVAWQVAGGGAVAVQLLALRALVDHLTSTDQFSLTGLAPSLIVLCAASLTGALSSSMLGELRWLLSEDVGRTLRSELLAVMGRATQSHFDDPSFHHRLRIIHETVERRIEAFPWAVLRTGLGLVAMVAIAAVLVGIAPLVLAVMIVASIPLVIASRIKSRILCSFVHDQTPTDRRRDYLASMFWDRRAVPELIAHDLRPALASRVTGMLDQRATIARSIYAHRRLAALTSSLASVIGLAVAMVLVVGLLSGGTIAVSDAAVAAVALNQLRGRFALLALGLEEMQQAAPFITDLARLDAELPPSAPIPTPTPTLDLSPLPPPPPLDRLVIDGVSFTYPGAVEPSLLGVSFTLERGQIVALVGENGSGKTTLARLVAGLYPPTEGTLWWNEVEGLTLAQAVAAEPVVIGQQFQDFNRYELTVADNIVLGRPDHPPDPERMVAAARSAAAHDWIQRLPEGYDTVVSRSLDRGVELSGGQWQRLALARTIYRAATITVLDEPTSAQDPAMEAELLAQLRAALVVSGSTVLLISHRFSTVRWADRIGVLHQGRLVEWGTHDELMEAGARYHAMFTAQAERFLVAAPSDRPVPAQP